MRRGASQPIRHSVCPCRHHVAHSVSVLTYLSLSPILPFSRSTVFSNRISPSTFTLHYLSLQSFVSLFFRPAFSPSSIGRSTSSLQKPNDMKLTRSRSWSRNPEEPTLGKMYLLCIFENQSRPSTAHPWHTESHRLWVSTSFPNFPGMKTSPLLANTHRNPYLACTLPSATLLFSTSSPAPVGYGRITPSYRPFTSSPMPTSPLLAKQENGS